MAYFQTWFWAFLFTQLVEVPIYAVGLRVSLLAAFGASAITHPLLWFVIFPYLHLPYVWLIVVGEGFAWLVEAVYLALVCRRRPRYQNVEIGPLVAPGEQINGDGGDVAL